MAKRSNSIRKWEYCAVDPIRIVDGSYKKPLLILFSLEGVESIPVVEVARTHDIEDAIAITISKLGGDGWEMAGCGNLDAAMHTIYFKRPKEN